MADRTDSDSRHHLSVTPPQRISKDFLGSENTIPLSPQWLLPKSGESKPGIGALENHFSQHPTYGNHSDIMKSSGNGDEIHEIHKKKDVFRNSLLDMEAGRRDHWRDEERDTNSSMRKDRWRDGDKDLSDNRRTDRWVENSSSKHLGEVRRVSSERWSDSSNRDTNYERRESKWNTRWGPDDKETEGVREKWADSGRDGDVHLDKGLSHVANQGKDEREGDHYRPWRPNSLQSRGRGEPHHQTVMSGKQGPTFSYGRGRGETTPPTFSLGRGRVSYGGRSLSVHSLGSGGDRGESGQGEPYRLRYSRTKLLDVYRITDMSSYEKLVDGFLQVPPLTQDQSVEPLALCAPTSDETAVLKGIDIGDIVSSGAPQISKDGRTSTDVTLSRRTKHGSKENFLHTLDDYKEESADNSRYLEFSAYIGDIVSSGAPQISKDGRTSTDATLSRRTKHGSKENFLHTLDDCKEESADNSRGGSENISEGPSYERHTLYHVSNSKMEILRDHKSFSDNKFKAEASREYDSYSKTEEVPINRESSLPGNPSIPATAWQYPSQGERSLNLLHDGRSSSSELGWSDPPKELNNEWESKLANPSVTKDMTKWHTTEDPILHRQPSGVMEMEQETRKAPQPSPDELTLFYKDPQGRIQGPFIGSDIISWFEGGYFGLDLLVCPSPNDLPWLPLGDVMPHLRAKAGPPPGFNLPKQNEFADASGRPSFRGFGKLHTGLTELDVLRSEPRQRHGSMTEAENRFLESLMSGSNMNSSTLEKLASSEGMQGYIGSNSSMLPPSGGDSGNNVHLLAKRMALERQKSLSSPYPYWPGRDAAPLVSKSDIVPDSTAPQSKLLSSINDNPCQPLHSQNADFLPLQGISDRSTTTGVNNGLAGWSNFQIQSGTDQLQNKIDFHHDQNFPPQAPFGIQQQWLQSHNQLSLTNPIAQAIDNPSSIFTPEKLMSSGLAQDPQLLDMLQQQYLLQLHSQAVQTQQMSMFDKLLLFKQQQKQEEQQQLLRQQLLLSQRLSEHQPHQRFGDPSFGQLQAAAIPSGNASIDPPQLQPSQELFQIGSQVPIPIMQDQHNTNFVKLPTQINQDVNYSGCSEASLLHLPHQLFGNITHKKPWVATVPEETADTHQKESSLTSSFAENSHLCEMMNRSVQLLPKCVQKPVSDSEFHVPRDVDVLRADRTVVVATAESTSESLPIPVDLLASGTCNSEVPVPEHASDVKAEPCGLLEEQQVEREMGTIENIEVKNIEVHEQRKASEKKPKKQKSSKSHTSSDQAKEIPKDSSLLQLKKSVTEKQSIETDVGAGDAPYGTISQKTRDNRGHKSGITTTEHVESQQVQSFVSAIALADDIETVEVKSDMGALGSVSVQNSLTHTGQRAWKPAPGVKPKSLLEIQQEEQRKSQTGMVVSEITSSVNSMSLSTPWVGVVANPDSKMSRETHRDAGNTELSIGKPVASVIPKSEKSHLHDLLAEEVLAKSNERDGDVPDSISIMANPQVMTTRSESIDDNFIEAKDTKKGRKKSARAKGAGAKVSMSLTSAEVSIGLSPIEKGKSSRPIQQEKEVLPAIPSGPSLGDFVLWKGESASSSPSPAWSTESGKLPKAASLRDILKEQEKKVSAHSPNQISTPQKSQPTQSTRTSGPSWSLSASSPAKASPPIQINSHHSQSKYKGDDDLFWGPIDQSKQETKQVDFPHLASQGTRVMKSTPVKGTSSGSLGRQKSVGGKSAERSLSSSSASSQASLKGKRDVMTNHSEATDFRDWCQSECLRLIGTKDMSFLEFCSKQSRSEAEMLLIENLGSYDPNHEFIDKFLNYKELLPADVLEIAFQSWNDRVTTGFGAVDHVNSGNAGGDVDRDTDGWSSKGAGKKGKKGKKVSPSVLGFNVVSNRIMMGEIQSVED